MHFTLCTCQGAFALYIFFMAFRRSCPGCCIITSLAVDTSLQIHCPRFTSGLTPPPSVSPLLAMRRTGFVSAPHSTQAGCASSAPASSTPAVTEQRASRSRRWRPRASVPMAGRVSCVKSVSVKDQCRAHLMVLL